jgi:hypothetical protein
MSHQSEQLPPMLGGDRTDSAKAKQAKRWFNPRNVAFGAANERKLR